MFTCRRFYQYSYFWNLSQALFKALSRLCAFTAENHFMLSRRIQQAQGFFNVLSKIEKCTTKSIYLKWRPPEQIFSFMLQEIPSYGIQSQGSNVKYIALVVVGYSNITWCYYFYSVDIGFCVFAFPSLCLKQK